MKLEQILKERGYQRKSEAEAELCPECRMSEALTWVRCPACKENEERTAAALLDPEEDEDTLPEAGCNG